MIALANQEEVARVVREIKGLLARRFHCLDHPASRDRDRKRPEAEGVDEERQEGDQQA